MRNPRCQLENVPCTETHCGPAYILDTSGDTKYRKSGGGPFDGFNATATATTKCEREVNFFWHFDATTSLGVYPSCGINNDGAVGNPHTAVFECFACSSGFLEPRVT